MKIGKYILTVLIMLLAVWLYAQPANDNLPVVKKKFRAAVVKIDITPEDSQYLLGYVERKSTGVHDHIYHRILVLDDGNQQFILVSTDVCQLSPGYYDEVAAKIKGKFGISPVNFWWATTHTHSAPEMGPSGLDEIFLQDRFHHKVDDSYTALIEKKLIEGINDALSKLVPARLGVGWGYSKANINRRAIDINKEAHLGMNPDGEVDQRIGLLRIDEEDGKPLACIANYPIHGTVLSGENLEISGDAPGIVSEYFEQEMGIPLLFINGAAGNLAPIYSVYSNPETGHLGEFRVLLGNKIIKAYERILSTTHNVTLKSDFLNVETLRKRDLQWPKDLGKYSYLTSTGQEMIRLPIRLLKINEDIIVWGAPLELFCEISNEIRSHSPFSFTFYFGYINGSLGYLLSEKEYEFGGYEVMVSPFTPGAGEDLIETVTPHLLQLKSQGDKIKYEE